MSKRDQVYEFVRNYISQNSYAPTREEIACACELASRSGAAYHIDALIMQGKLFCGTRGAPRNLAIRTR